MRYLDVCSGISAPTMAWKPLGWEAACFAEIEPAPRAVLAHHYPNVPLVGDFTQIKGDEYGPIDLLVGGTPCQSFSVAGLRGGLDDDRGNLALEYLRLADRARPRWLVWENVLGVLSINSGRAFGAILGSMGELGYGFAYRVLDAQHFGVPQRRRRVFAVGYLGDWRRAAAVLFERHSLSGHPAPRRSEEQDIASVLAGGARQRGGYSSDDIPAVAETLRNHPRPGSNSLGQLAFGGGNTSGPIPVAAALAALAAHGRRQDFEVETFIAHSLRCQGFDASEDGTGSGTPLVLACFSAKDHGADAGDIAPTLRGGGHTGSHANAGVMPAVAFTQNSRSEVRKIGGDGQIVGALAAEAGAQQQNYVSDAAAVRRLTPRECERLQGFPDDFTLVPYRRGMMADGPRYKMLGNSMAVPVVRWIGERIAAVEALDTRSAAA